MNFTRDTDWERLKGWLNRQWRMTPASPSAAPLSAVEREDRLLAERVAAWEDEGGAPAASVSPTPTPAEGLKH